jgi:hypothetical protein
MRGASTNIATSIIDGLKLSLTINPQIKFNDNLDSTTPRASITPRHMQNELKKQRHQGKQNIQQPNGNETYRYQ